MRDLIRLRSVVRHIVTRARQHLQGFLLRHGRKHGRGTAWRMAYRRWLSTLAFEHPAQQIAFQDYVDAVTDAEGRLKRVEEQIFGLLPDWNLCSVVDALQAMRGIAINAVVLVTEVGDFTRFSNPRQLMAYFGLVPGCPISIHVARRQHDRTFVRVFYQMPPPEERTFSYHKNFRGKSCGMSNFEQIATR
jgi:transposase